VHFWPNCNWWNATFQQPRPVLQNAQDLLGFEKYGDCAAVSEFVNANETAEIQSSTVVGFQMLRIEGNRLRSKRDG
jgi:hypothetical protein